MKIFIVILIFIVSQTFVHSQTDTDTLKLRHKLSGNKETIFLIPYKDYKEELKSNLTNKTLYKECVKFLDKFVKKDTIVDASYFIDLKSYAWSYDSPAFEKCKANLLLADKLVFIKQHTKYTHLDIDIFELPYYACNDERNEIVVIYYSIKSKTGEIIAVINKTYLQGAFSVRSCF